MASHRRNSTIAALGFAGLLFVAVKFGLDPILRLSRQMGYRKTAHQVLTGAVIGTVGWIAARFHLDFFDSRYLGKGELPEEPAGSEADG